MLQISDDAVDALREMGALRITGKDVDGDVEIEIDDAEEPVAGDQVVERDGVTVYLDAMAADVLDDQVLGIEAHGDHVHFLFDDQPA
jgi:Fe-S cluster assembly iron-binding protein IscA